MSTYLTYEEMRLWRSSTEKITLEEFAERLGKSVNRKKETNDLYDQIKYKEVSVCKEPSNKKESVKIEKSVEEPKNNVDESKNNIELKMEDIPFKKKLTPREEAVLNYFKDNKGRAVFVKDLARVLNLPNDYVYKYIKNLREKLAADILVNADNGGYILDM